MTQPRTRHRGRSRRPSTASLVWSAICGLLLSILVGVAAALLAHGGGHPIADAIMTGAAAAGGFAGLWIAGTAALYTAIRR
ncbi:type VI protein secretion system component VasK [Thermocatellispora tengchongensis]|uniref:Type VI protein secretion system component VasK n=1 Tax=Thermocatellispora tengchongensis TaxID=1073253 RepID=A0A840P6X4_9ACTN|nr:hypothetical protein [Thermocatellispora tengchongensis]MBB5134759.1 type VI protein secretion system component VasK [Thermocatellispora tengchongensis]